MTPMLSPLLALQKAIAKAKGAYGAQRVEKAADLVPNLEKMYQMEALEDAFGGDNAKALIVMPPERFEEFARPIFVGDPVHRKMMEDNVKSLQKLRQGFADVPFLEVGHKPGQLPFISGHEGRHRSRALQKRGEKSSLVNVFPKYREDFPRRTQEEFIEEMRRQLGESRLVTPEGKLRATPENPEGAIEFPEIFREGGAVHMKDGSTDKVRQLIEETKGTSGRYDPMRAQRVSEYEKGFRDYLAAQQEARESLFKPSPTVGGMAKGAAGALAGYAAQVPGIAGDILSLYDEFKPERAPNLPEWARALPTTERLQEYYLPENASPELQAGVTGGNLFALGQGVAALPKVVAGGARMAGKGAQALAPKAAEMTEEYLLRSGLMPQVFIGPSAKTWNPRAAFKASQMERAGKSPEEIWAATKTFKGADGNWRQEISDQSARFLTEADLKAKAAAMYEQERVNRLAIAQSKLHPDLFPKQLTAAQKDLRAQSKALREERTALHGPETNPMWRGNFAKYALEHPELYEAYPELADIIVKQGIPYSPYKAVLNQSAPLKAGDPVSSHISMEITEKGLRDDPRSSALHEMQHAIQGIEGWAPGGNMVTAFLNPKAHDILNSLRQTAMTPMSFEDYAKRFSHVKDLNKGYEAYKASIPSIVKNMDRELQTTAAEQYYRRLAGEAEARATQARRNMSVAERAQVAPGESYDVPINEQIVNPPSYAEGGTVSKDAMRMKSWDKQIQRKDKGGEVTQAEIDAASKPYRMPAPKRRGSIDASGAKAAGTLLSGIASAVPAGYAGLLELARTRDPKMAADAVEALQERYMSMPEDERTAEKIERLSGALEKLGEPARLVGETTLRATGSPLAATIAELGLDPMNYLPLIGKAPAAARAAKKAAQNLGPVADQMLENYMLRTGMALPVVKRKGEGGNWLTGSVEDALANLKPRAANGVPIEDIVRTHNEMTPGVPMTNANLIRGAAINDWIEKKLTRYIKNEMGTPEDPVRLAADAFPATKAQMLADKQKQIDKAVADMEKARAVRNFTPEMMTSSQARIRELQKEKELLELRMGLHFDAPRVEPTHRTDAKRNAFAAKNEGKWGYGQSPIAQNWEDAADAMINVVPAESFQSLSNRNYMQSNPQLAWIDKLSPDASIYGLNRGVTGRGGNDPSIESLGFQHLIDELRNATNPESGLPRNLLINSKDLPKWTVPQAIEHVDKINAWRAVQRQEAAKAVREGIPVHKEYPEGYQWLSVPDLATDEKALRYATDIGCEGGWCTQGEKTARKYGGGGNRLFVLHDPKGKPVVQIQVEQFGKGPLSGDSLNEVEPGLFEKFLAQRDQEGGTHDMHKWLQTTRPDLANRESIGQIKGILNKPPKPEYLPYVQDFVRSGQWSDIGDIQNTGMRAAQQVFNENELLRLKELGQEVPPILTGEEIQNLHNAITPEGMRLKYDAKGNVIGSESKNYARGGAVKACDCNNDAIKMAVWNKQIQRKANGGAVKKMSGGSLVRAGTKAASAAKALTSAGKSADEMAEVRKVAPEGQQNVQEILEPKSNVGKGAGKASDLVTDLRAAPKVGVASPLATRSAADKAEEALQKTQAFKSLKGQDRQRAIDSVRAKAERSGIPRTKADLNAAMAGEEDIARSMLNSPAYKIANVVPRATVNKALETRQMYRAEPPTTPGPNASEKEWADWGASHGVNMTVTTPESLGISDLMSRREAMIPGGLKGTFTIPDLFWIKANNFNPAALPQDVHTELMKKFIRTFKINSPDEVDVFNRLNFALLSPNAPLTPNEFLAQRARLRTPEELSALAGRVGEEGLNRTAAAQLGVGQAGSGGMGVLGTADLSSQAMLAKLIKDKPSMFQMAPGETMRDVTMRVMNQAPGLGPKTASLGTPWLDLEKANTSAVDLHMIRDAYPMLLHDPIVGKAFRERMAGLLKTKPTAAAILSKPEKDVRDAAIAIVGGTDMSRLYRLKSGELNRIPDVATPDKLAYEPKSFSEFNPFYSRVVDYVDQSRGANPDIELFPEQWRKWDVLRQRIEPHEFAHPDYRKLPRQSFSEMQNALTAHKEAGYTQSNNPTMNLSDWRKLYYGRAVPEILAPTAAAGAAAAAAQTLLSDDSEKARGGAVHMAEGGLTSDDLILEERKL